MLTDAPIGRSVLTIRVAESVALRQEAHVMTAPSRTASKASERKGSAIKASAAKSA
jgi:hypothetical protein